ncbi:REP-associated tyrosine transposase [Prosthecobacter sp.]|uniref:REP-associated tyrosine transposase n=1 Tax=Prosthecobacter sp. TaxID=1965333 RepID=UPI003784CE9A
MQGADRPDRKKLHHDVPHWVEDGSLFFITVNCSQRGSEQLTLPAVADGLLDAARFYHDQRKWHITLWLLMPDHLHALLSFPRQVVMEDVFQNWKRYTARQFGIVWQDGFFDHRLRDGHEENAKHHYIRQNPVRKGLCARPEEWPHQLRSSRAGSLIRG